MSGVMEDKKGLILGVSNRRSLGWAVARTAASEGAQVGITYHNERFEKRVRSLVEEAGIVVSGLWECDATDPEQVERLFESVAETMGGLDFLVHCWAYAPPEALREDFVETSWDAYRIAHQISAYSLIRVVRRVRGLMGGKGSVVTLTYYGSEKVIPGYNAMGVAKASLEASLRYLASEVGEDGIRVNAVSPGPVNTLSARGVPEFSRMLAEHAKKAPLGRNIEREEVGKAAVFLASDLASGITGEVLHVDAGYNIMGT